MRNDLWVTYEFAASIAPLLILVYRQRRRGKKISNKEYYLIVTLAVYIISVFHFTQAGTLYDLLSHIENIGTPVINIEPFSQGISKVGYMLNIVLFIPFGILVPRLCRQFDYWFFTIPLGTLFSFFIEMTQLLNDRITDIDDLIMNTIGVVIGYSAYCIYKYVKRKKGKEIESFDISPALLILYIFVLYAGRFVFYDESFPLMTG